MFRLVSAGLVPMAIGIARPPWFTASCSATKVKAEAEVLIVAQSEIRSR
jgi:hypothetical protein